MMYGNGFGWGWMMLMPVLWVALVAVIIWAVVRLAQPKGDRGFSATDHGPAPRETPQEILDRRLASGEIDIDTYTEARARLAGREPASS